MRFTLATLALMAAVAAPAAAQAPDAAGSAPGWQLTLEPYFMAPFMDGSSAIGPVDVRVSSSPADIFSNLN